MKEDCLKQQSLEDKEVLVRVVKGDWKSLKTLFLSEPMTIQNAMVLIKKLVQSLPLRGEGTELVKFVEDKGTDFDYMSCGGWLIFTHKETIPW